MKHASTRALLTYWNQLRGTRVAPERSDVDPAQIRSILVDTFVLEVDRNNFDLRLVGDRTNSLFMRDLKGHSFIDLWHETDRDDMRLLLSAVLDDAIPVVAGGQASASGRQPLDLELLVLPLRHNRDTHARMLGCLAPHSIPSWFGLLSAGPLTLGSMRTLPVHPTYGFVPDGVVEPVLPPTSDIVCAPTPLSHCPHPPQRRVHRLSSPTAMGGQTVTQVGHLQVGHLTVIEGGLSSAEGPVVGLN